MGISLRDGMGLLSWRSRWLCSCGGGDRRGNCAQPPLPCLMWSVSLPWLIWFWKALSPGCARFLVC